MDTSGGVFQIRPFKDFIARKGRDRILSLPLLANLPTDEHDLSMASESSSDSEPRNAYDFMQTRRSNLGDPTVQRWNASVRLASYAAVDEAPLCVRLGSFVETLFS